MDPRVREDDGLGGGMDPRVREDDGRDLSFLLPSVIPAQSLPLQPLKLLR